MNEFVVVWVREKVWLASAGGISTQFAEASEDLPNVDRMWEEFLVWVQVFQQFY